MCRGVFSVVDVFLLKVSVLLSGCYGYCFLEIVWRVFDI